MTSPKIYCHIGRFKNNGENFHVKLPGKVEHSQQVSVPEDLVQIQAYLRWERKGKQMYTPEQEKASTFSFVNDKESTQPEV